MLTLAQAGISRINLSYNQVGNAVSGNIIARTGTYVRTDGSTRAVGSVDFALEEVTPVLPEGADLSDLATLASVVAQKQLSRNANL